MSERLKVKERMYLRGLFTALALVPYTSPRNSFLSLTTRRVIRILSDPTVRVEDLIKGFFETEGDNDSALRWSYAYRAGRHISNTIRHADELSEAESDFLKGLEKRRVTRPSWHYDMGRKARKYGIRIS